MERDTGNHKRDLLYYYNGPQTLGPNHVFGHCRDSDSFLLPLFELTNFIKIFYGFIYKSVLYFLAPSSSLAHGLIDISTNYKLKPRERFFNILLYFAQGRYFYDGLNLL